MGQAGDYLETLVDRLFPSRVCRRQGHNWIGFESMGPHSGEGGGVFYGLRFRIGCTRCRRMLDHVPEKEWPDDAMVDRRFSAQKPSS
jgi:hypothetical protein